MGEEIDEIAKGKSESTHMKGKGDRERVIKEGKE